MSRIKLIDYAKQNGFNQASKVRLNDANKYPYITLIDSNNGSHVENLYLGKRYAGTVKEGEILPINDLYLEETTNAQGEIRLKITDRSGVVSAEKLADYTAFA